MNFKVGDKVVFSKENHFAARSNGYKIDKSYVIKKISDARDAIEIINEDGIGNWLLISRFEKVSKKKRIAALEKTVAKQGEEIGELKLIVQQLRKPSTVVEEALVQVTDETIIEFEGTQYKKVDREAREGDVVRFSSNPHLPSYVSTEKFYKVNSNINFLDEDKDYIDVYFPSNGRTPETVDVYELIVEDNPFDWVDEPTDEEKSPNQLRAEVIEKAKVFIETSKSEWEGLVLTGSLKGQRHKFSNVYKVTLSKSQSRVAACDVEFIVNEEKRTVVALLRGIENKKVYARGIAKCMPDDVFNEWIGKAIALGRALGLDVSEFEGAVQPTVAVIGMKFIDRHGDTREIVGDGFFSRASMKSVIDSANVQDHPITIINDTNAIYGGVE